MAITQKDFEALQPGAAGIAQLIVGQAQRQKQAELEKQLELQKAQEMLPIQKQGEQQKSDIAFSQSQRERASALDTLDQMRQRGYGGEGAGMSVSKEGVGVTRGFNPATITNQQDKLYNAEAKEVHKAGKPLDDISDTLDQIRTINTLAKSPNAYDQKNIAVLQARIAEGKGQRLLQSVIQSFGAKGESLPGWLASMANKVQGGASSTITPEELRQLSEHTQKMGDEYANRFNVELEKYKAIAPDFARRTMRDDPAAVDRMVATHAAKGQAIIDELNKSKQQYQDVAAQAGRTVPVPPAPQEQGLGAWLLGKAGLSNKKAAPATPPQTQSLQGLIQPQQPAQPAQPIDPIAAARAEIERRKAAQGGQ